MRYVQQHLTGISALLLTTFAMSMASLDHWPWISASLLVVGTLLGQSRPAFAASVLLATYPMLDFTPWSGQWVFRHHDFLVLGICVGWCVLRWRFERDDRTLRTFSAIAYANLAWATVSALLGYYWLREHGDPGAIIHLSPNNAFRSTKGIWMAFAIVACYPRGVTERDSLLVAMSRGAPFALIYFGCWCILERLLYVGWGDWGRYFRIGGPMSGASNLGGQASEAVVLVLMVWSTLWWRMTKRRVSYAAIVVGISLGMIGLVLMQTRGALAVMLVGGCALITDAVVCQAGGRRRALALACGVSGLAILAASIALMPAMRNRLDNVLDDFRLRIGHYRSSQQMLAQRSFASCFGVGAGTFPILFVNNAATERVPGWFSSSGVGQETWLVLRGGESGFLDSFVGMSGSEIQTARVRLRGKDEADFGIYLCEKNLTHSVGCRSARVRSQGLNDWHWQEVQLTTKPVGAPQAELLTLKISRPIFFSVGTPAYGKQVEIDEIQLLADDRTVIWQRSSFEPGFPGGIMTTDYYWPFHIDNDVLLILTEQGLVGCGLMLLMILVSLRGAHRLNRETLLTFSTLSLVLIANGLINSPLDTPEASAVWWVFLFSLGRKSHQHAG